MRGELRKVGEFGKIRESWGLGFRKRGNLEIEWWIHVPILWVRDKDWDKEMGSTERKRIEGGRFDDD